MNFGRLIIVGLFVSSISILYAFWPFSEPKNYDECVTKKMKGVTSDYAAKAIVSSCLRMFPLKAEETTTSGKYFNKDELSELMKNSKLTLSEAISRGGDGGGAYFNLSEYLVFPDTHTHVLKYHNNTKHLIRSLTIKIYPADGGEFIYKESTNGKPYSSDEVNFNFSPDHISKDFKYLVIAVEIGN